VRRASDGARQRLNETFQTLCRIESPSRQERACADWVGAELRSLGLEVEEDDAGTRVGSNAGNLLSRIAGRGEGSLLLCAHLDTVPLTAPIDPVIVDGGWENANDGILGADNKAAVAILIEIARRLSSSPPQIGVELLFTICEEVSLRGSREFDVGRLRSSYGYVFDHATPIGEIVLSSPSHQRLVADMHGRAAHAGLRPEAGRSAVAAVAQAIAQMRLGRLDEDTTANVGTIEGGTAINVIPEHCRIEAEVRSIEEDKLQGAMTDMIDRLQDAANASECDVDVTVERMFEGYRTRARAPHVLLAERALQACGYEPRHIASGGASDANSLNAVGFPCVNLADGSERNHQPDERISVDALEGMFEVAIALVEEAGNGI
jgi:tripeptide aminopeptidase